MLSFSVIVLTCLMTVVMAGELTAVVNTASGPVQGQVLTTIVKSMKYASFSGIKYAKPPVGYLRFKPPVPIDPWTETLNASVEGDKCAQMDPATSRFEGSEDCLFLNVATLLTNLEEAPKKLKPVIVWFHGGGFVLGTSSIKIYRPDHLVERDVVYVSVNYRLGVFGFLTLNHPNATGNAGLKDQNLALKWIQANIRNFGGNPDNVTLLGQSAGAASVAFHTLSDASAGLFHGTISMSGSALNPWGFSSPKKSLTTAKKLAMLLGTNSNDKEILLKTFYAASTEELTRAPSQISSTVVMLPTLEDSSLGTEVFLSECSINKYTSGNFSKVPQILGFMQQECLLYLTRPDTFNATIKATLENYPSPVINELINIFGGVEKLIEQKNNSVFEILVNETSDILFKSSIDLTQSLLVANNDDNPVFYYHLTFNPNISIHELESNRKNHGATHNDDLAYIFSFPEIDDKLGPNGPIASTVHRVSTMWTNFAKYGNPTPHWVSNNSLGVIWPTSGPSGRALEIGAELRVVPRPVNLNTDMVKAAKMENLGVRNGCPAVTTIKCQ